MVVEPDDFGRKAGFEFKLFQIHLLADGCTKLPDGCSVFDLYHGLAAIGSANSEAYHVSMAADFPRCAERDYFIAPSDCA